MIKNVEKRLLSIEAVVDRRSLIHKKTFTLEFFLVKLQAWLEASSFFFLRKLSSDFRFQ